MLRTMRVAAATTHTRVPVVGDSRRHNARGGGTHTCTHMAAVDDLHTRTHTPRGALTDAHVPACHLTLLAWRAQPVTSKQFSVSLLVEFIGVMLFSFLGSTVSDKVHGPW
jgi:hypothetical protein